MNRIEITRFVIDTTVSPPAVTTQYRINKIPTSATGSTSSSAISAAISNESFRANVLTQTVAAVVEQPAESWTSETNPDGPDSPFTSAPTDGNAASVAPGGTSLFVSHDGNTAVTVTPPSQNFPSYTSVSS